jgi:hypothetical protein
MQQFFGTLPAVSSRTPSGACSFEEDHSRFLVAA